MLCGGAALLVVAGLQGESLSWPPTVNAMIAWIYLVGAGSLVGFSAFMYLLSKVPSPLATSYAFVNPVIAVFLGVAIAGESLTPREIVATSVILASVVLLTRAKRA